MTLAHGPPPVDRASRATNAIIVAVLVALAALAWFRMLERAGETSDMILGLPQVGRAEPGLLTAGTFLVMWVVMTVAMMFPAVVPMVVTHRAVASRRGAGTLATIAFVGGYLIMWTAAAVVPLGALLAFQHLAADAGSRALEIAAGSILVVAGAYQFSDWKARCLRSCRSPLTFVLTHDFGDGVLSAARTGAAHGAFCLGCCWSLMAVLLVVGLMNVVWMAVLSLVLLAERSWRLGPSMTRLVGIALIVLGAAIAAFPAALPPLEAVTTTLVIEGG